MGAPGHGTAGIHHQARPLAFHFDNNYFNDAYQGIPKGGYNVLTDALLEGVEVRLDTDYFAHREELDARPAKSSSRAASTSSSATSAGVWNTAACASTTST